MKMIPGLKNITDHYMYLCRWHPSRKKTLLLVSFVWSSITFMMLRTTYVSHDATKRSVTTPVPATALYVNQDHLIGVNWVKNRDWFPLQKIDDWHVVNGRVDIRIHSAFLDNRDENQSPLRPFIRMTAIVDRKIETLKKGFYCKLFYDDNVDNFKIVNMTYVFLGVFERVAFGITYAPYMLSCRLPNDITPRNVSVVTNIHEQPTTLLDVIVPEKPAKRKRVGVCASFVHWNIDPHRLVEWVELLRIMGVSYIGVTHTNLDPEPTKIFKYYQKQGIVDFHGMGIPIGDGYEWSMKQNEKPSLNNCQLRNMHKFDYIADFDIDEFIVPQRPEHRTISDVIKIMEKKHDTDILSYWVLNAYHWTDGFSHEDLTAPKELVTQRVHYHIKISLPGQGQWKSIINPRSCLGVNNHFCMQWLQKYLPKPHSWLYPVMDPKDALMHHYKPCIFDRINLEMGTCKRKETTLYRSPAMMKYKDELIPAVTKALKELGLPKLTSECKNVKNKKYSNISIDSDKKKL